MSRSNTYLSERVISQNLHKKFVKVMQFLPENLEHTQKRMNKMRLTARTKILSGRIDQSHLTMRSFKIELVSMHLRNYFPQYTEFFNKLLPKQLNQEGQWEVAISEISHPSRYQNATEVKFMFFDRKLSKL